MELLERYLAAVAEELPADQQADVSRELRANILDQLDALRERSPDASDPSLLHSVLLELGPPRAMAQQFHQPRPLILPQHLPIYRNTLFLVIGLLFLINVVHASLAWMASEQMGLLLMLKSIFGGLIRDGSFAFTVISLAFWLMGRNEEPAERASCASWNPDTLPPLTRPWQRIDLNDIFSDLATYLFLLIVIWYPMWADLPTSGQLSESARLALQLFSPVLLAGIALSLWQLLVRVWTRPILQANLLVNALLVVALISLIVSGPLWSDIPEVLQGISPERLAQSISITLLIIALFPAWEVIRDWRRLRRFSH